MTELRIGILGSGKGSNCEALLDACEKKQIPGHVVLVLSDVAGAPILERARKREIEARTFGPSKLRTTLEPELEEQVAGQLLDAEVQLVVLAGYMRVVKTPLLRAFPGRIMNIHPSLLPSFPGLRAWEQALQAGVRLTGATVHFVDEGLDSGPIILQSAVPVFPNDTPDSLHARIQVAEHMLYPEAVRLFALGQLQIVGHTVKIRDT